MSTAPLAAARPAWAADGTPYSAVYDDVYHSAQGGPAQARHVFLAGNALPGAWRDRDVFTVLETGFGIGINFLATWQAWQDDPRRAARLHYVSIEKHPFCAADLADLHIRYPEFTPLSEQLLAHWPLLTPGLHRIAFDAGRVVLTLAFADIGHALRELRAQADAIYLDGFSPAKNPDMWTAQVMKALARQSRHGASLSTWCAARAVRDALVAAGFSVEARPGFGAKREMSVARLSGARSARIASADDIEGRDAIVIGAGIAGASVSERLCAHGWHVTLLEQHAAPAGEASGNHAGTFHPLVTRDDSIFARLTRAGFLSALRSWHMLAAQGVPFSWERCGVLQLARDEREDAAQCEAIARLGLPARYVERLDQPAAAVRAGLPVDAGGLWFPDGGWIRPPELVRALLAACGARLATRYGIRVDALSRDGTNWVARDGAGNTIAVAPLVVLANAGDALRLAPHAHVQLRRVRGQLTYMQLQSMRPPRAVLLRGGFVLPPFAGTCVIGASYDLGDDDAELREDSHQGNLARLEHIAPGATDRVDMSALGGRVAFRCVAPDRLPLVGAISRNDESVRGLFTACAYGSRGLVWSALAGELIACMASGEPLPLEAPLIDALSPQRFAQRAARRSLPRGVDASQP